jgi:hypothetical protein
LLSDLVKEAAAAGVGRVSDDDLLLMQVLAVSFVAF